MLSAQNELTAAFSQAGRLCKSQQQPPTDFYFTSGFGSEIPLQVGKIRKSNHQTVFHPQIPQDTESEPKGERSSTHRPGLCRGRERGGMTEASSSSLKPDAVVAHTHTHMHARTHKHTPHHTLFMTVLRKFNLTCRISYYKSIGKK